MMGRSTNQAMTVSGAAFSSSGTPDSPPIIPSASARASLRTIPLRTLVSRAFIAMVRPHQAFQAIRADEQVPFPQLLFHMAVWGAVYALLHFRAFDRHWLWQEPPGIARCRFLAFVLAAPAGWFLGSMGLWQVARWLKRPLAFAQVEVATFYLWLVWALMPLIDVVHWFGWPFRTLTVHLPGRLYVSYLAHASWAFAFPWILLELTAFFLDRLKGTRYRLLKSLGLSCGILVFARGLWEPLYGLGGVVLQRFAPASILNDWWLITVNAGLMLVIGVAWRRILQGSAVWKTVTLGLLAGAAVILAAWSLRYLR